MQCEVLMSSINFFIFCFFLHVIGYRPRMWQVISLFVITLLAFCLLGNVTILSFLAGRRHLRFTRRWNSRWNLHSRVMCVPAPQWEMFVKAQESNVVYFWVQLIVFYLSCNQELQFSLVVFIYFSQLYKMDVVLAARNRQSLRYLFVGLNCEKFLNFQTLSLKVVVEKVITKQELA